MKWVKQNNYISLIKSLKNNNSERCLMFKKKNHYYNISTYSIEEVSRKQEMLRFSYDVGIINYNQWEYLTKKYVSKYFCIYYETNFGYEKRAIV